MARLIRDSLGRDNLDRDKLVRDKFRAVEKNIRPPLSGL